MPCSEEFYGLFFSRPDERHLADARPPNEDHLADGRSPLDRQIFILAGGRSSAKSGSSAGRPVRNEPPRGFATACGRPLLGHSDCKYVARGWAAMLAGRPPRLHDHPWSEAMRIHRRDEVEVTWIAAHLPPAEAAAAGIRPADWLGNLVADSLAGRACCWYCLLPGW